MLIIDREATKLAREENRAVGIAEKLRSTDFFSFGHKRLNCKVAKELYHDKKKKKEVSARGHLQSQQYQQ